MTDINSNPTLSTSSNTNDNTSSKPLTSISTSSASNAPPSGTGGASAAASSSTPATTASAPAPVATPAATNKQRALEKLKAARMRLARAGVTSSSVHIRNAALAAKERGDAKDNSSSVTDSNGNKSNDTNNNNNNNTHSMQSDTITNINGKREHDNISNPCTTSSLPPSKKPVNEPITNSSTNSTNTTDPTQHRNATKATNITKIAPLPINKKFEKYVDYDFSKIADTSGGFFNEDLDKSFEELVEKQQRELESRKLEQELSMPPVVLGANSVVPVCAECESKDLDFKLYNVFGCKVCRCCRDALPEKYSLLTKTEVKEDYLLTDSELRDTDLFPRLERPNPHKTTFNNMMLFLRYQVEEFAYKKWGGAEGLDEEYEKRVEMKKKRKEKKLMKRMEDMRRKTKATGGYAVTEEQKRQGRHEHEWSAAMSVENASVPGTVQRRCAICGLTTEEVMM